MGLNEEITNIFVAKEIQMPFSAKLFLRLLQKFDIQEISLNDFRKTLERDDRNSHILMDYINEALRDQLKSCKKCSLCFADHHTQKVPGEGKINSPLMIIGEGPGFDEDKIGRPFVGRAGQLLTTILSKLGIRREAIYISNVIKCRPPMNRKPLKAEIVACSYILEAELTYINPKVIMTLGSVPLNYFRTDISVSKCRGQWIYTRGFWIMPTFHPAYILRQSGKALYNTKWEVWNDFNKALAKVRDFNPDYKFS